MRAVLIIIILETLCSDAWCKMMPIHPEVDLSLEQRIQRHGYPVKAHRVVTEDDYILSLYHIPHGLRKDTEENRNKSAVLLVHGMASTPLNFIVLGKERSMPYYFADRGYDVWLFSARGVDGTFKQKHLKYDWNRDNEYWVFSIHEMGIYDLTASIDYVLNYTGQAKVSLLAHSAGGNEAFCMFSEKPEYNEKVKVVINMSCSPIIKRSDFPMAILLASLVDVFKGILKYLGSEELFPIIQTFKPVIKTMCADSEWSKLCFMAISIVGSHKSVIQDPEYTQIIVSNLPRMSNRQLLHFMDNLNSGKFRKYDFGPKKNLKMYGNIEPPHYNLSAVKVPCAFYVASNDDILNIGDIYESVSLMPNAVLIHKIKFEKFTHTDFIFGTNATELVYEPVFQFLKNVDNGTVPRPLKGPSIKHS